MRKEGLVLSSKIKEVIFDFDGTIADTLEMSVRKINQMTVSKNDELSDFKIRKIEQEDIDIFRNDGWQKALKRFEISVFDIPKIALLVQKEIKGDVANANVFDGMIEVFNVLKEKGYVLGILTSNSKENVEELLKEKGITSFDYVVSDKSLFGKDILIKKILKQRGLKRDEIIYVGDETRDWVGCKKARVDMVGVSWGFNSEKLLRKRGVSKIARKPSDILTYVC